MLGQNHRSSLSILHGWMEYFWLYSGDRQHRWHRYGRLDGGLSCFPDTSASSTGLSYWSHLKAHQSCQRHSEVTLCSNRLTTGLVQYWSLIRYELMYNDNNVLLWIFGMIIINMYIIFFLALITFIYAIIGMTLFGHVKHTGALNDQVNFETFGRSMQLLFRLTTSAGWNDVLEPLLVTPPYCGKSNRYTFFVKLQHS